MIELQLWQKYDKSISTNQLIDKQIPDFKKSKMGLIRLNGSIFRMDLEKGHSNVYYFEDGTKGEFMSKYQLFEQNFLRLLGMNYKYLNIKTLEDELKIKSSTKILYSTYFHPEFLEVAKKYKLFYITLIK